LMSLYRQETTQAHLAMYRELSYPY
jgi:hypothetical protein